VELLLESHHRRMSELHQEVFYVRKVGEKREGERESVR
jgi:hypothetical protein